MTSQVKLIGKTILDKSGITEFFGGEINVKDIKPLPIYVDGTDWVNFKSDIDRLEKDPVQVDLYLKAHGLEQVEGLKDYILNNDIKQDSVSNLIQTQNYKNIADQAHGFLGVKKTIDEYNEGIENGTLNTDKFNEIISQSNSSLGNYLTGLKGTTGGIFDYGKSLATATVKTFALEAATMALNAATSLGVSFLISAGISALTSLIDNLIVTKEEIKELADEALEEEKSLLSLIKRYNELDKTDRSTENTENIKNLNSEINNILGDQAEKIDLVNGKLDEQSDKLRRNLLQKLEDDKTEIDASVSVAKGKYDEGAEVGSFFDGWGNIGNVLKKYGATGISKNSKDGRIEVNKANVGAVLKSLNTEQQIQQLEEWIELLNKADKDAGIGTYKDEISSLMGKLNEAKKIKSDYDNALSTQKENETKRKILNDSISGKINDFSAFEKYRNEIEKTYNDNSVFRDQMLDFIDNIYPEYAEKVKNTVNAVKNSSPISFTKAWNKLKESEQNSLKNEVLEGVLDKESISQYQDLADNFSLEQIRNEILSLIPLDEKLSQFIDDSEKLTSAYTEMKKNKTVSTKTLLGMPEGIRRLDGYTDFRNTVADPKTSKESKKGAFEDIITEYLNANQTIVDASDKTKNYVVNALKDAGITNAETLVNGVINCKDTINKVMDEIDGANETDVKNFAKACTSKNLNNTKLYNKIGENTASMLNQLKDKYADDVRNFGNSLQSKLKAEKQYASAVLQLEAAANGGTSNAVMPNFFGKSNVSKDSKEYKEYLKKKKALDKANKDYKKNLAKLKKDLKKVSIAEIDIDFDPSGKKKEKKKSTKETKTEIDWLSRRLTRMQSIIDLTASKLQNLFSIKAKTGNVNDQIKQTTTLMEQYGIAAKRYQDKADSIAEGYTTKIKSGKNKGKKKKVKPLPKSIINQIKSGKITKKSYPKLIKKYGQSYADRINQYIDYYDKAQDAKKNKQDAKAKVRDLKQQNLQYYVDDYNAKADLAEINSGNAVGYQKQNSFIKTQLSCLQKSYEKQIAIAKLSEDKTEQDRLQAEYEAKKVELKQKQIENLKTDFENKIGFIKNDGQDVSNRISETEARGDIVQSSYYSALNRYEQSALNSMKTELQELKKEQNSFAKYSPEWYSLQSDIQSVENSISETNISIIENNKKIGELRQSMYDDIASRNNNAGSEAQFLAGLLGDNLFDDKTGSMTKEGLGVLGTYGIELEANTNTALSYANQRKEIEQAIASYNSGNAHALDSYGSLNKAEEKLNEAIKNQQEATTAEYATMKKIYDMMVKRYETQLAYMKSIIDAKKQVLSMEKDLYDYQKNISSQTKNIAALEKQLAALKGDDSEEGRAKRSKLQVSLDEANQELQDAEYERYISDQENMLDNMYTQYEDLLSELEKDFETVVKDGMNIINETASGISTTLNEIADKYGYNPSGDMKEVLRVMKSSSGTIVNTLPGTITNGLSELGRIFQEGANAIVKAYSGKTPVSGNNPDKTDGGGSGGGSNSNGGTERFRVEGTSDSPAVMRANERINQLNLFLGKLSGSGDTSKPLKPADPDKTYKSDINKKLSQYGYVVKSGTGTHGMEYINLFAQALGLKSGDGSYSASGAAYKALAKEFPGIGFQTGGIVRADGVPKTGDYVPVRVNPNETILTQDFTKMLPDTVDIMKDFVKVPDYIKVLQERSNIGNTNTFGDIVINAELPNVKDAYDFANDLKNNKRTQRAIEVGVHDLMKQGKLTSNIQRI